MSERAHIAIMVAGLFVAACLMAVPALVIEAAGSLARRCKNG